jgi:hypothetical protein
LGESKKKIDIELGTYFPGWFGNDLEYLDHLRQWYLFQIEGGDDILGKRLTNFFIEANFPRCFNPFEEHNILIKEERNFEEICNSMEDNGVNNVRESTVFQFYSKVLYLEDKFRKLRTDVSK